MIKPYIWQEESVKRMVEILSAQQFCLNTSDTGTGKTVTALETIKRLKTRALVVCPKQVHTSWARTAKAMDCEPLIYGIVNAERLQYKNDYFKGNTWAIPSDVLIIWDEVHRGASGPKSRTSKILALTRPLGYKVLAMSATIASSPLHLRAVGYLAGLHQFKPGSYWRWCLDNGCFKRPPIRGFRFPKGAAAQKHMLRIHQDLKDSMVRIRVAEVPDFPETQILANLYDLEADYTKAIQEAWKDMREALKKPRPDILTERLRAREFTELNKVELLLDLTEEALTENKSVVLFINFRSTHQKLLDGLKKYNPGSIIGGQKNEERQQFIDDFQADERPVMVCMSQAGGIGINLHGLPGQRERVSFLTPSDSVNEFTQCLGRIHRTGGTKTVQTLVLAAGTIEETVHRNLQGKLNNLSALQDGDFQI